MDKKFIVKIIILLFTFCVLFGILKKIFFLDNETKVEMEDIGEWLLVDDYDSKNSSFEKFLKQKDSYDILKQTYEMLKETYGDQYYDVSRQDLGYLGKFPGGEELVSGGKDAMNQEINDQIVSPLLSLQVSSNFTAQKGLEGMLEAGTVLEEQDYQKNADQMIPVLAGASFKNVFKIGDTFQGKYLGEKDMMFEIKGFLKDDAEVSLEGEEISLNRTLVFPSIVWSQKDPKEFQKTLLSVKCQGYLHYDNKKELQNHMKKLKKIKKQTGFRYIIPEIK